MLNPAIKPGINPDKCTGCAECFTVCRYDAVEYNWGVGSETLQKRMAEYAYGGIKDKQGKCFFINVLVDMTTECDCMELNQSKCIPDMVILASRDPVAIDKATLDLTIKANGRSLAEISYSNLNPLIQIEHAAKIGMGKMEYQLVQVK